MVNNHYPQQTDHHLWPTAMDNIFPSSEHLILVVFIDNHNYTYEDAKKCVYHCKLLWFHPRSDRLWQKEHQWRPTATSNIFLLSDRLIVVVFIDDNYDSYQYAQTHVSIIRNSFGVILEVTDPNRVSVIGGPQWQPEFFRYLNVSLSFCFSATIKIQIKILKIMYVSSKPPLVSLSNL